MTTCRSVCLLCRSFLLRETQSITYPWPPPELVSTTHEILQLSKMVRSDSEKGEKPDESSTPAQEERTHGSTYVSSRVLKKSLRVLPPMRFSGEVHLIKGAAMEGEFTDSIHRLLQNGVLGFDVECPLTSSRPVLVQLASRQVCVMWRVNQHSPFPTLLHGILSSPDYLKVGHGSLADARSLLKYYHLNTVNIFDTNEFLRSLPQHLQPPLQNLQGLVGIFLGRWLSKSKALSEWNRDRLSHKQLMYASTDVWASLEVYLAVMKYASDIEVTTPPAVECTLRMCKPQLLQSLTQGLQRNVVRAEQARVAVEALVRDGGFNCPSPDEALSTSSHTDLECALNGGSTHCSDITHL